MQTNLVRCVCLIEHDYRRDSVIINKSPEIYHSVGLRHLSNNICVTSTVTLKAK
jgi:hypothetical protein